MNDDHRDEERPEADSKGADREDTSAAGSSQGEGEAEASGESPAERQEHKGDSEADVGQPSEGGDPSAAPEGAQELEDSDSPGAQPDASEEGEDDQPRTSEGGPQPDPVRQAPVPADQPQSVASPTEEDEPVHDPDGQPLLVFVNEVAGGRKLLAAVRERAAGVSALAVVAPANQPAVGGLIDPSELREAALSRIEVTMAVLSEFGFDSVGDVMDRDPHLALDDAVRAFDPGEVLLSCLIDTRSGLTRKDLIEWARKRFEPEVKVTHIPVRVNDDSIRWDVTHTLVVATRTVASPDLIARLKERHSEKPHRFTIISPRSGQMTPQEISRDLASTLAELYRSDIDATGQPMSPDPFSAIENAIANYRIDEVLISTLAGERSKWMEEDLVGQVRGITEKPVVHVEGGRVIDDPSQDGSEDGDDDGDGEEAREGEPVASGERG